MLPYFFNIRVYGIMMKNNDVLITHEMVKKKLVTKFPGGGLEFGEGTINCLKREFMEEIGMEIKEIKHFYTTDFFVQSAFKSTDQIISIYYLVSPLNDFDKLPAFISKENEQQTFEWKNLANLDPKQFYFPIDQVVVKTLRSGKFYN